MKNDTIAAIATSLGHSAIGIIRLSGPEAIFITKRIFIPLNKKMDIEKVSSHTLHYGKIIYNGEIIDEVVIGIYKEPHSYTGEDIVEIYTHGSPVVLEEILRILVKEGARLAERGEFTKRAFLNGKIDLLQAESINEIIRAESKTYLKSALSKLQGDLSKEIRSIKDKIENLRIYLEASIDFPEDVEEREKEDWIKILKDTKEEVENLLERAKRGEWTKEGYKIILVGRINVGKSSLFNAIMKEDRAIVAPIPGTTRDYIEGEIYLAGYLVRVYDTAGLGIPQDILEKMGMKKTREVLEKSNLIIFVLDGSEELKEEEKILFNEIKNLENKSIILVINKMDLPLKIDLSFFPEEIERVFVSAKNKEGIEKLEEAIERHLTSEELYDIIFLNIYHQEELQKIKNYLEEGIKVLKELPSSLDILGSILYDIEKSLGNILGEEVSLDIVDKIFANFCVGK